MPYPPFPPNVGGTLTPTLRHDTYPTIDPTKNEPGCRGKSVLISGAGKGLGRSIAISYARAGASHIAISARNLPEASAVCDEVVQAAKGAGQDEPQTLALVMDVCDRASLDSAASTVRDAWGRLDILINNAAYLAPFISLADGDEEDWWHTWEVNVRGVYWLTKALLPLMLTGGDKTVINLTSTGALALTPGASAYQPSKLAVMRLTEYLMVDYIHQGLLSYSVHPATVATNLARRMPDPIVNAVCIDTPELAGDTIAWLTSERREWLAGRYVSCNWDMTELFAKRDEIEENDLLKLKLAL
ncbi:MAG: hypothetical protein Q9169_004354 [Polycauliona sp. 2 TL-2023]